MKKLWCYLALLLLPVACAPSARPIEYGVDKCDFCRMTIVDPQHAAELVTNKGRVYKFDAVECMVQYRQREADTEFAILLVNDYLQKGTLLPAETCTYLISPNLPSPMGANLSAFAERTVAEQFQQQEGGLLYDWDGLSAQLIK